MRLSDVPLLRWLSCGSLDLRVIDECRRSGVRWRDSGLEVRALRGTKMQTVQGLFDEFSAALQFPVISVELPAFDEAYRLWLAAVGHVLFS